LKPVGDLDAVDAATIEHAEGAEFAAGSKRSRQLVESISGRSFTPESTHAPTYQLWFSLKSTPLGDSADRKAAWS
jgi:hypothetical protein